MNMTKKIISVPLPWNFKETPCFNTNHLTILEYLHCGNLRLPQCYVCFVLKPLLIEKITINKYNKFLK